MNYLFAALLTLHGLIHLVGAARALGFAKAPGPTQPISRPVGLLWLLAAVLFLATAAALFAWPRGWWAVGAVAIILSQVVILTSWKDARFGSVLNVIALVGVAFGFLSQGPFSLRAEYDRNVVRSLQRAAASPLLTEQDLAPLPPVVQRYVRISGAVGQPRVRSFWVRMHGRIRRGEDQPWMAFTAEQYDFLDPNSRYFLIDAAMFGIPFQALHIYIGPSASMRVKVAAFLTVADARGPEMDVSETVTLFNDMCLFAPGSLVDPAIRWQQSNARTSTASFTSAGHAVTATLFFNDAGELVDFVSEDRFGSSPDGKSFSTMRWSTPVQNYRSLGFRRIIGSGEARWHAANSSYEYIKLELDEIQYNPSPDFQTLSRLPVQSPLYPPHGGSTP